MSDLYRFKMTDESLSHHGIEGQKWGVKNGPPYPLDAPDHSSAEKKHMGYFARKKAAKEEEKQRKQAEEDARKAAKKQEEADFAEAKKKHDEALNRLVDMETKFMESKEYSDMVDKDINRIIDDEKQHGRFQDGKFTAFYNVSEEDLRTVLRYTYYHDDFGQNFFDEWCDKNPDTQLAKDAFKAHEDFGNADKDFYEKYGYRPNFYGSNGIVVTDKDGNVVKRAKVEGY